MQFLTLAVVFLPVISALAINPIAVREKKGDACAIKTTVEIKSGDTLTKIGEKNGSTAAAIYFVNKDTISDPDVIFPGQKVKIPKETCNAVAPPLPQKPVATAECAKAGTNPIYVVVSGDNLTKIAEKYKITLKALIAANKFDNPDLIYPDQKINIPVCKKKSTY